MAKRRKTFWDRVPPAVATMEAGRALDTLRKGKGGPFNKDEIRQLIADVLGLPQPVGLSRLTRLQCKRLVAWLIYLGWL